MRFTVEKTEAASDIEAAFLLRDTLSDFVVTVLHFRTIRQLDDYQPSGRLWKIRRRLPIAIDAPVDADEGLMRRIVNWYFYVVLKGQ